MAGIFERKRDLADVRRGLQRWLAHHHPEVADIYVSDFGQNHVGGFSSDSLIFSATGMTGAAPWTQRLVARLPPAGDGVFRDYDLEWQFRLQNYAAGLGVPVAKQWAYEADESWLGCPFVLMDFVEGRIPDSQPPYSRAGWMLDEPDDRRARLCDNALASMALLHRNSAGDPRLAGLSRPDGCGLEAELQWCLEYIQWASDGSPPAEVAEVAKWCSDRMPTQPPANVLCWGDARLGNVIFDDDLNVAAFLDWEMATVCPPELDLGWFTAFRTQIRARTGVPDDPELSGLPNREATIALYEAHLGRPVIDLEWYEVYSMLRLAGACMGTQRIIRRAEITDHFILNFAPVEPWVLELISSL